MGLVFHAVCGCECAAEVEGVQVEMVGDGVAHEAGEDWIPVARIGIEGVVGDGFWRGVREKRDGLDVLKWLVVDPSYHSCVPDGTLDTAGEIKLYEYLIIVRYGRDS